jgi:DNA-binding GntR family transcriptional regulator
MAFAINKQSLDKQAAEVIRQEILSGAFPPGFRLVEAWLAGQFGLSRGTIRGGLSMLLHEGLVTQVAYTKWIVAEISDTTAWELFALRSALEGLGAGLAARNISREDGRRLSAAYKELVAAASRNDRAAATEADFSLHKLIIEISGHQRLAAHYRLIEQQVRLLIASSNALLASIDEIVGQHRPIVKAILAKQPASAERLIRHHNLSEGDRLTEHIRAAAEKNAKVARRPTGAARRTAPKRANGARKTRKQA